PVSHSQLQDVAVGSRQQVAVQPVQKTVNGNVGVACEGSQVPVEDENLVVPNTVRVGISQQVPLVPGIKNPSRQAGVSHLPYDPLHFVLGEVPHHTLCGLNRHVKPEEDRAHSI